MSLKQLHEIGGITMISGNDILANLGWFGLIIMVLLFIGYLLESG